LISPYICPVEAVVGKIVFERVVKQFDKTTIIRGLNLAIADGSFTVVVGPSGCGKTTLLRMVAGISAVTSGKIYIDDVDVTNIEASERGVAMVFQNYALYPTMTVRQNIEFGLKNIKVPKEERDRLIAEISKIIGLSALLDRRPSSLSGGQRQRVALARAMVKKPKVFLMDEPLSNLDAKLRVQMRTELIELHERLRTTFIYVTHDQVEAMSMADTIVLMNNGQIIQTASPEDLYHEPAHIFAASFIGTPPMNILRCEGCEFAVGFRAEHIHMREAPEDAALRFDARIITREMLGSETNYKIHIPYGDVMAKNPDASFHPGDRLSISIPQNNVYLFQATGERIPFDKEKVRNFLGAAEKKACQEESTGLEKKRDEA
jgi:sn-glycerol 3-phosphate transport system ATP-binding protein